MTHSRTLISVALFTAIYLPVFPPLVREWIANPDYSHAFLTPFISAYFLWTKREELKKTPVSPSWAGCAVIIAGIALNYLESMAGKPGPHQPQVCWIGKGWRFTHCAYGTVPAGAVKYPAILFEKIIARRGGEEALLFTTYIINGRSEPRYRRFRLRLAYDSLVKRRAAVLAMQLSSPINGPDVKAAEDTINWDNHFLRQSVSACRPKQIYTRHKICYNHVNNCSQ